MEGSKSFSDYLIKQLSSETDSRSETSDDGFSKYNVTLLKNNIVPLGSCTASSLHNDDFSELILKLQDATEEDLSSINFLTKLWGEVREEFLEILQIDNEENTIVFVPSGTDSETLISSVINSNDGNDILNNIVVAPLEVGSGTILACGGKAFSEKSPDGSYWKIGQAIVNSVSQKTKVHTIELRSSKGRFPPMSQLEREIEEIIRTSVSDESSVCVHVVAGSKTGAHAPSNAFISVIENMNYSNLHVIVDAAQGRFSRTGVRKSLKAGRIVTVTGSKFFGAPPFCGAVIFPKFKYPKIEWKDEFSPLFNQMCFENRTPDSSYEIRNGLLLRWMIGVSNMRNYYSTDPRMRLKVLKWFESDGVEAIESFNSLHYLDPQFFSPDERNRLLATNKTIHTFQVSHDGKNMGMEKLKKIHSDLVNKNMRNGIHIGQPVLLSRSSGDSGLRIALGSRLIVDTINDIIGGTSEAEARKKLHSLVSKACWEISMIVREMYET